MGYEFMYKLRKATLPLPPGCVVRHDLTPDRVCIALDRGSSSYCVIFWTGSRGGCQIFATPDAAEAGRLYGEILSEVEGGRFKIHFHADGRETIEFLSQDLARRIAEAKGR